jgi:hypothetical protein
MNRRPDRVEKWVARWLILPPLRAAHRFAVIMRKRAERKYQEAGGELW